MSKDRVNIKPSDHPLKQPVLLLLFLLALLGAQTAHAALHWEDLGHGLSIAHIACHASTKVTLLRIDPAQYTFVLGHSPSPTEAKTLSSWLFDDDLSAAINASMYQQDGKTSTGYLRYGTIVNNPRLASRFGAFFVANPDIPNLPSVTILEGDPRSLAETLRHYQLVIQNYRLLTRTHKILWPSTGDKHAIAAVGIDRHGFVLFIYCQSPIRPYDLAACLIESYQDIRTTMYVEGGSEAGLIYRDQANNPQSLFAYFEPIIPNIIGIRAKKPNTAE
ncbi:MAG: phosphodiester glycosidase family protein [Desulfovibrio sp.]|nr:phosphodiester glycosidase family protein [Desulfovibrio sp.]